MQAGGLPFQGIFQCRPLYNLKHLNFKDPGKGNDCVSVAFIEASNLLHTRKQASFYWNFDECVCLSLGEWTYFFFFSSFLFLFLSLFLILNNENIFKHIEQRFPQQQTPCSAGHLSLRQFFFSHANPWAHLHKISVVTISFRWADFYAVSSRRCTNPGPPQSWS